MIKKSNILFASVVVMAFTIISKAVGFLREIVLAYFYGAGPVSDAYLTATLISAAIFGGLTGAIVIAYIPQAATRGSDSDQNSLTSNILNIFSLAILGASLVVMLFIRPITRFFAVGFNEETLGIATNMALIMVAFSVFFAISDLMGAFLQSRKIFWFIGISNILLNIVIIISIALSGHNMQVLSFGYGIAQIVVAVFIFVLSYHYGFRYRPVVHFQDVELRHILAMASPVFLGTFVQQLNLIVDRNFASILGDGVVSAISYSNKVNSLLSTIIIGSVVTVLLPTLSELACSGNLYSFKKISLLAHNVALFLMIPIAVWLVYYAKPVVDMVFLRGAFDQKASVLTSELLTCYALGLPFLSINQILVSQFYALKDTKTPAACNAISLGCNICLNFILIQPLGYEGLALATSFSALLLTGMLFYRLRKKTGALSLVMVIKGTASICVATTGMMVTIIFCQRLLASSTSNTLVLLTISSAVGGIVYLLILLILGFHKRIGLDTYVRQRLQ